MIHIMQGDAYPIDFELIGPDGEPLTDEDVEIVELMIGSVIKKYPETVQYDPGGRQFVFDLTQEDSFSLCEGTHGVQARVKRVGNTVEGWHECGKVVVSASGSQEIL